MAIELESGGAKAVILPAYGGRLHQLYLPLDGGQEPLLWSPDDHSRYDERPTRGGAFPMAPWPNRIRGGEFAWGERTYRVPLDGKPHANHGRVFQRPWEVVARTARVVELVCAFDDGWPWPGKAWQRFELSDRALRMKLEVRAEREPFPAGAGWHPWFRRDVGGAADIRVTVPAEQRYVIVDEIPTRELVPPEGEYDLGEGPALGQRRIDACYTRLQGPLTVDWGRVRLVMSVDCAAPHVQVYTPEFAFCVEPQSCAPDAFNLAARGSTTDGMAVVAPGRPLAIESTWTWETRDRR